MKKVLCLLLALLMLMLVSCQASTDDGTDKSTDKSTAESVPEKATPWSELKTLLGNVDPMVEMPTAFKNYSELSASSSCNGTYAMSMTMMGNTQTSGADFSMDGSLMKVETTVDLDGLSIPVITWMDGAESYIQYPTLYPDVVFPSEEDVSSATGSTLSFGSLDVSALPQQMIAMLEEVATPDKDMTVAEADGMLTYTLPMDAEAGGKLFDELEELLSGIDTSSLMGSTGDIFGQTGSESTTEEEEVAFDSAVFTVVTDQNVTLNYCLQKLQGETVVESIRLDTLASETNILYTMEKKVGETVETAMTVDVTESAITIKGTANADASTKLVADIAFTAVSDTALSLSGTMNIDMVQGATSLSIPITLDGAISVTGGVMDMDLNMDMEVMGFEAKVVLSYDMTYADITLELPPVLEFDEDAFYEKLVETYPEHFASNTSYFVSDDGTVGISFESETAGMLMLEGTYVRSDDNLTLSFPGGYTVSGFLYQSGDSYSWNGREVDVRNLEGIIGVTDIVTDSWYWFLYMYEDGTCTVTATFSIADDGSVSVVTGANIPAENFRIVDDSTILFYNIELTNG